MSGLMETRVLTLKAKRGKQERVEVRQLDALQLFDYQEALLSAPWPTIDENADEQAQKKTLLDIQRVTLELNVLLAALGLHYLYPDLKLEQMKRKVLECYPDPAHILRLAMAVKEISGMAMLAADSDEPAPAEPIDPKKG
ncbi:hypothetical protein [Aeromonas hydrophila]|uniref:hypothetical protein n=1 Tax=Aeromonas hydrophila TaxID=644 RepID=UPI002B459A77|nr:hypothetical protein [Aeromonas hydrophila]